MNRVHIKGNTFVLEGKQLIPYYQVGEGRCILLDTGRANERAGIEEALAEAGLTMVGIILSHMHYDHHENTKYFKEKFGVPAAMPRGEAEICRNAATLKNHLFNFSPGLIATQQRLQDLICPIERPIEMEETSLTFQGATFGIVHSPGHSPDHICIITPDNVCYLGDAIMCGRDLARAQTPFVFGMELDLRTKARLKELDYDKYIIAHYGVLDDIQDIVQENIDLIHRQLEKMAGLVTRPMTFCDCYAAINEALDQVPEHPVFTLHLERYLRPYVEYLVDTGKVRLVPGGAPTVAPL